ncbi:MAG: PIN domain-containing protein [Deltaproteobacteria bacterium]|nr:PIN domain-containing protein [Deltaproteobacteria bacterium]
MKKYIIDTNALISFVTDRNQEQQVKVDKLFNDAARLRIMVLCPQNVLTEFVYVMDTVYQIPKSEISKIVRDFIDMPGIEVVHDLNMKTLISYWPEVFKDYGDAIIATLCKNTKGSLIVTFDRKFRAKLKKRGLST